VESAVGSLTSPSLTGISTAPGVRPPRKPGLGASSRVALGILLSRLSGLLRESVFAHYFGASAVADAFKAAVRIPNMLNNLFGEGVLSASFVTVYSKLRALGEDDRAEDLAAAVFGVLTLVCAAMVLVGILCSPILVDFIAPGFHAEKRALTIHLVRILFPGTAMLVMSAWCLGVLNSHRRFLLSYTAPVAMNIAMIACLVAFGGHTVQDRLAIDLAWAFVLGSVLQFLVQLPRVLQLLPAFRPLLDMASEEVRTVVRNFGPIFVGRGVVQVSAFVDSIIASKLPNGAVSALSYGQTVSILPISLFSMSVSAAELPALSSAIGAHEEVAALLRQRLTAGLRRIAFFIVPSAVAFLMLGDVISGALYQSGRFQHADAIWQWGILAGSAVGLLASGLGRLYSSGFYALLDTKTPLRFAIVRVTLTTLLGILFALFLPQWLGIDRKWGVAGLTASAGIAGWVEFLLLRRGLAKRIGATSVPPVFLAKLWSTALLAGAAGYAVKLLAASAHPRLLALAVLPVYGITYFWATARWGVEESRKVIASLHGHIAPLLTRVQR
jgi:putative peptidoglycan lipid II flippase